MVRILIVALTMLSGVSAYAQEIEVVRLRDCEPYTQGNDTTLLAFAVVAPGGSCVERSPQSILDTYFGVEWWTRDYVYNAVTTVPNDDDHLKPHKICVRAYSSDMPVTMWLVQPRGSCEGRPAASALYRQLFDDKVCLMPGLGCQPAAALMPIARKRLETLLKRVKERERVPG